MRTILALAVVLGTRSSALAADATPAWNEIMAAKKLTACVVPSYQPYSAKDASGTWSGFAVEMAKDVAKSLHVDLEYVETSFKTVVLDIQSG
jgi:ABC-type amino acid transport substrate-binding protein